MGIGFKGGLAAFGQGYLQAEKENYQRARQQKEDDWVTSQRERTMAENKRQDDLRDKMAKYDRTTPELVDNFVNAADDAGNVPRASTGERRQKTDAEQLEDYADMQQGVDPGKAFELRGKAKALTAQDYANKFMQFRDNASSLPVAEQVKAAVAIFNDAPNPGMISNVRVDEKTGAVTFDAFNKVSGQRVSRSFDDPKQLLNDLYSFVAPENYRAERAAATERALKKEDELDKMHVVGDGATLVNGRGKVAINNPKDANGGLVNIGTEANPQWVSSGKKGSTPIDKSRTILGDALEKSDIKATDPKAYARAHGILDQVHSSVPNVAPGVAADIALTAAADEASEVPKFVKYQINTTTGEVDKIYRNPQHEGGRPITIGRNAATLQDFAAGAEKGGMQQAGAAILGAMNEPTQKVFLEAAKDPAKLKALQAQIAQDDRLTPELKQANIAALTNRVQILSMYTVPPPAAAATDPASGTQDKTRLNTPGGLTYEPPAGSRAAKIRERQRQQQAQEQQAQAQRQQQMQALSQQFNADLKTMTPLDLERKYNSLRGQLPSRDAAELMRIATQ